MSFFSGVRLPLLALPVWGRVIAGVFPLTGSLVVLRGALIEGETLAGLWPELLFLLLFSAALLGAAMVSLRIGEARARRTGSLTLY